MICRLSAPAIFTYLALSFSSLPSETRAADGTGDAATLSPTTSSSPATTAAAEGDSTTPAPSAAISPSRPAMYTVVSGDTLPRVAQKFGCSSKQLKKLNHLSTTHLHSGQMLKLPPAKVAALTGKHGKAQGVRRESKTVAFHSPHAEPVQAFDLSSPAPAPVHAVTRSVSSPPSMADHPAAVSSSASRPVAHSFFSFFHSSPPSPLVDWGARFAQASRDLGNRGISYDGSWCPPGETHSWLMDCSNTARYLYHVAAGIRLPRTASDQYYYLHLQNKAWDVPQMSTGFADCNYLRRNLKAGDLLFWENTYRPERQPPITHVMVFLGTNARGEWVMGGSQTGRGGEHNRSRGGPDVYVFDPNKPCGGYSTWMGLVHHQGRFCAFGRPLEADRAKLAIAAND